MKQRSGLWSVIVGSSLPGLPKFTYPPDGLPSSLAKRGYDPSPAPRAAFRPLNPL